MLWKCTVCGYLHEGSNPPAYCPKCGSPAEKYVVLSEEDAQKIYSADRTNDIHMEISKLAMKMAVLAEEGIKIALDPPCVSVFTKAKEEAWIIKQRSKAEIAGHVGRGKW